MTRLKTLFPTFLFTFVVFAICRTVYADDVVTPFPDWLSQVFQLGRDWKSLGTLGAIAVAVKLLVDATKTDLLGGFFKKLPGGAQILVVMGLATVSVGLTVLIKGGSWVDVLSAVIQSSSAAVFLHEVLKQVFGIGASASSQGVLKK
jgi:hypothetical protein